ncbi:MAG: hypothetical protein H8E55_66340 [Pelagibacterales bacterium]|nr:hypothetical protein [Pelagibacterales bacterium]
MTATYEYLDLNEEKGHFTTHIPYQQCSDDRSFTYDPNIVIKKGSLKCLTSESDFHDNDISFDTNTKTETYSETTANTIKRFKLEFFIPKGTYSCDELCIKLNENYNLVSRGQDTVLDETLKDNPLLQDSGFFNNANYKYIADNGQNGMTFKTGDGTYVYFIGSSSFSMSFDGEKFKLDSIHTPYFTRLGGDDTIGSIGMAHYKIGSSGTAYKTITSNGGIFLTGVFFLLVFGQIPLVLKTLRLI